MPSALSRALRLTQNVEHFSNWSAKDIHTHLWVSRRRTQRKESHFFGGGDFMTNKCVTKMWNWSEKSAQWNILIFYTACLFWSLIKDELDAFPRWIFSTWGPFRGGVHPSPEPGLSWKNSTRPIDHSFLYEWPNPVETIRNQNILLSRKFVPYFLFRDIKNIICSHLIRPKHPPPHLWV